VKLRILTGVLGCFDMVPDLLDQWLAVGDGKATDGNRAVCIAVKEHVPGTVSVSFAKDGKKPVEVSFDFSGIAGKAVVRDWKLDAATEDTAFNPPAGLPVVEVEQAQLYRTFAAMFDLLMPQVR
jgi:hypothetical protein